MNKTIVCLFSMFIHTTIITGILFSCRSEPSDKKATGFPQSPSSNNTGEGSKGNQVNFVSAAKAVTPGVVHIKTSYQNDADNFSRSSADDTPSAVGSGSGVVISSDGYIATNNHVVENATQIEVIFTDRSAFTAKLIGRDPNTDLALLKVDAKDLSIVELGNSDNTEVGEWVLAVGYPFSLNTTATAGIISAKGRSIGIITSNAPEPAQGSSAIESFIQTDAAINPGNSGGALVDLDGKLIGINTAIASYTGSYAGYAFAIPINLAKKILDDLKEFGVVKRGILGVSFPAPDDEARHLKEQGINPGSVKGVFITGIQKGGAADVAGLQEGDIIQSIDNTKLFSSAEFSERIARRRPGDKVELDFLRNGKSKSATATLKGEEQQSAALGLDDKEELHNRLGAIFAPLTPELKDRYNIKGGVVITDIRVGGFFHRLGIPPGTIIAFINGKTVDSTAEVNEALMAAQNSLVQILGIAPDGSRIAFNFSLGA